MHGKASGKKPVSSFTSGEILLLNCHAREISHTGSNPFLRARR